ncbi:hypothetical protein DCAR_0417966 [Daucus carota subsp. sativus]|uniref:NAC domain-containing protein n=1 Tax=Daucus carota subsp. sativus TaxID=79200 RepID=A0AAF0WZC1_DAUCS|nr:PREDICTED: protein CUP-SHAPED COTYLEDON 2 [Daucus carota subsp. sativus]WOG98622.1 hypothetical protein DCAR_0417966 [Daucus carota subsp. sativus]
MEMFYHHFDNNEANLPPGFRFHPTDEELITYYLLKKVLDHTFTGRAIAQVDLNKCEPWELPDKAKMGEKEWYFYSLRDRKYPTGLRTNRATEAGYWKATGKDREIYSSKTSSLVGMKKTLVFYRGRAPKGEKSNWVMHEYRLEGKFAYHYLSRTSKDEWVISRVFQKTIPGATFPGGKKRLNTTSTNYPELSSSSSVSLPPLLDTLPYNATATSDLDSCSFDGSASTAATKEHVPCFSTSASPSCFNKYSSMFHSVSPAAAMVDPAAAMPPSSLAAFQSNVGVSAFPSLRSLQENMQLPFFFSPVAPSPVFGGGEVGNWPAPDTQKSGATELDCIWSF